MKLSVKYLAKYYFVNEIFACVKALRALCVNELKEPSIILRSLSDAERICQLTLNLRDWHLYNFGIYILGKMSPKEIFP